MTLGPELFIGLVGAVGTDFRAIVQAMQDALGRVGYTTHEIRLVELLHQIDRWKELPESPEFERYNAHMDAGNEFRQSLGQGDALARLAMADIREYRKQSGGGTSFDTPVPNCAYILRSLKHPREVETLRLVYGNNLVVVSVYSPRDDRLTNLATNIAQSRGSVRHQDYRADAERLSKRDEEEAGKPFGQNVRQTFPLADVFIDSSDKGRLVPAVARSVELFFGYPYHTPTQDEYAMFHAHAAALRSSSLARQVGAVICAEDGSIISAGTNEVPKAFGGLYWPGDPNDARDWVRGFDISNVMRRNNITEVLDRLAANGWLAATKSGMDPMARTDAAIPLMAGTQVMGAIEFSRAVHAEMAALLDCARRGVRMAGATLYTTTFPCHDCAKHVVAAGVKNVVYVEPYPKSLATEFHSDAIAVDAPYDGQRVSFRPFVGIAPRRYLQLFTMGDRKDQEGRKITWVQVPRFHDPARIYQENEKQAIAGFDDKIEATKD